MYFFVYLAYSAMFTIAPESFPTEIRGIGLAIANVSSRFGGITSPILSGILFEYPKGFELVISMNSASLILAGLCMFTLKETKLIAKQKVKSEG